MPHFITFSVASTNIFPLVNSKQGGQYVTEYNLKSREMVATNPNVKYAIGPSFIHSLDDFKVKPLEDTDIPLYSTTSRYRKGDYCRYNGNAYICIVDINTPEEFDPNHWKQTVLTALHSVIQIDPGRAVVNGHYVESLAPMMIDLNATNAELIQQAKEPLYGNLSIGIKSYFSTNTTMSGSMLVENADGMYIGVQLVIEKSANFKTPDMVPALEQAGMATADVKLADFTYVNGIVTPESIKMNPEATRYIPSERITDFNNILSDKYVTSANLVDGWFYTFSGTSKDWCNSTDSLMVWDIDSIHHTTTTKPIGNQAEFTTDNNGNVHLIVPHKQPDGFVNSDGDKLYYANRDIRVPTANYDEGSSGIVTVEYTNKIKDIARIINTYKEFTNGKQIAYWDRLTVTSEGDALKYNPEFPVDISQFNIGDYILVREDYTISNVEGLSSAPSTMYFVVPGRISDLYSKDMTITKPLGCHLGITQVWFEGERGVPTVDPTNPENNNPTDAELKSMFRYNNYYGSDGDYFEIEWHYSDELTNPEHANPLHFYYPVTIESLKTWSEPILLTGGIPLATDSQIGGFYNVTSSSDYTDGGYVYLDNTGHLRLMDYSLLRSGALAYQLGADISVPANSTLTYIQEYLNEYVNERVAFKSNAALTSTPTMVDVYITLPKDGADVLNIYKIDSRFDTGVYLHFLADDTTANFSGIVINISDCQKIRIDDSITTWVSGPMINIFRSGLYYSASVLDYIRTCDINNQREVLFSSYTNFTGFDDLSLWYSRFKVTDPELVINGMEVLQPDVSITTQDIDFWSEDISNDNHYSVALRSITMSGSGSIIGCSLYVSNNSTQTVNTTQHIIIGGDFTLPQSNNLQYPKFCIDHPLKVTGTFTTAYLDNTQAHWITTESTFTAETGVSNPATGVSDGEIVFNSKTDLLDTRYTTVTVIDAWKPGAYHIFYGGTTWNVDT